MAESWKAIRRKNYLLSLLQCFDTSASSLGLGGPAWLICNTRNAPIRSQSLSSSWFYSWLCCLVFSSELLAHSFLVPPENEPVSAIKTKPTANGFLTAVLSQEVWVHGIIPNHLGILNGWQDSSVISTLPKNLYVNVCYFFLNQMLFEYPHLTC